ncbi:hypothetical protein M6B38_196920 [Iris pallida]|uniref:Secreted protein n=1 Tax=Iris pallida TaxID=29817 RepID=A0AAX6ECE0_IRIPA|nr:hypothetical protein M6B38_196920 [Iris pallida]
MTVGSCLCFGSAFLLRTGRGKREDRVVHVQLWSYPGLFLFGIVRVRGDCYSKWTGRLCDWVGGSCAWRDSNF